MELKLRVSQDGGVTFEHASKSSIVSAKTGGPHEGEWCTLCPSLGNLIAAQSSFGLMGNWIKRSGFPWKWPQMLASYPRLLFVSLLIHSDILKLNLSCLAAEVTTTEAV